jgi:uncharacterized membrane protein
VGQDELIFWVPLWSIALVLFVAMVATVEITMWFGGRVRAREGEEKQESSTVPSAVLGLLALLLAFTYALAANHYDIRKELVLRESNAIGTAWLRTDFAPAPARDELRDVLRRYADLRVEFSAAGTDLDRHTGMLSESDRVLARMWSAVTRAMEGRTPTPIDALIVASVNDVIDAHAARLRAMRDHVPELVIFLLMAVALIAVGIVGYASGRAGKRNHLTQLVLPALLVAVISVTLDLDRPRRGMITVSQQSLIDLQQSLKATAPPNPAGK